MILRHIAERRCFLSTYAGGVDPTGGNPSTAAWVVPLCCLSKAVTAKAKLPFARGLDVHCRQVGAFLCEPSVGI